MKNTEKIMHSITKRSDLILLFFAILSFCLLGIFKMEYYSSIFAVKFSPKMALAVGALTALLIEGTRFSLMLSSAEDARMGKNWAFLLGLIASIGLLSYDVSLCNEIGAHWDTQNVVYINILQFIAVLGGVLEFRLCILMRGQSAPVQDQEEVAQNTQSQILQQAQGQPVNTPNPAQAQVQKNGAAQNPPPFPFFQSTQVTS